jgi:hypothetical protein
MRSGSALTVVVAWAFVLVAPSASPGAVPPNPNDPCARSGIDTCGTTGTGFYRISRYGRRWFGDFRGAVPGHQHAFCIDLRFWYASPSYRYREDSSEVLRTRDGTAIGPGRLQKMAYALWAYGRSTKPSRQAAVMMYVHSLMGEARPGEIDPEAMPPRVEALYRTIARSAARYHGPYRVETSVPSALTVGRRARVTVSVRSAGGHALPGAALSVSARGAKVPPEVRTDKTGRAMIALTPTAVDLRLRFATRALAATRPRIFVPTSAAAARNGQRLAAANSASVSALVSRHARPAATTVVSRQLVRPGGQIFDHVRVRGLGGRAASIEVELFGPFASRSAIACTGRPYWRHRITTATASEIRSPPTELTKAGFYVYREHVVRPARSRVRTRCGLVSETTLATPQIATGRGDPTAEARVTGRGDRTPLQLRIPALGIKAAVVPVGIDVERGVLGMSTNIHRVGWWRDGMAPGARSGTILIAGHFDTASAGPGAFFALPRAHRGQRVHVATADGEVRTYRVVWVRSYPKSALPTAVFATHGSPRLVLVTCGGRFDSTSRHYLDNIVVTAVPV